MTTTELIDALKSIERGASGRSREISFTIPRKNGKRIFIPRPQINIDSTGDGIAGAQITLRLDE